MRKILNIFDYIFYRIYLFFDKKNNDPMENAINLLTITQGFLIVNFLFILQEFIVLKLPPILLNKYISGGLLAAFFLIFNNLRYKKIYKKNKFRAFNEILAKESRKQKKIRGVIVLIYIFSSILGPYLIIPLVHYLF